MPLPCVLAMLSAMELSERELKALEDWARAEHKEVVRAAQVLALVQEVRRRRATPLSARPGLEEIAVRKAPVGK